MYILKRGKIASQTGDLGSWLVNTGYRAELVRRKIQKVNAVDRLVLTEKHSKIKEDSVTLVETFHPALYIIFDILKFPHLIIEKSPTLRAILPKPPRVTFPNHKTI